MKLQGDKAIAFARRPDPAVGAVLVFGEDDGVVSDTADQVISGWSDPAEPPDRVRILDDELRSEPARLFDALDARSLLGGVSLIRVSLGSERASPLIVEALERHLAVWSPGGNRLLVTAGALKAKSKLRAAFEAARCAVSLHVYADSDADAVTLVRDGLDAAGIAITPEALAIYAAGLPGHRALARSEIDKLSLYARGLDRPVDLDDIRAIGVPDVDQDVAHAITAAFDRDAIAALQALDRALLAGTSAISLVRAIQREAQRMLAAQARQAETGRSDVGQMIFPKVYGREWTAFSARLRTWPAQRLIQLVATLHQVEMDVRRAGHLNGPALRQLVARMVRPVPPKTGPL